MWTILKVWDSYWVLPLEEQWHIFVHNYQRSLPLVSLCWILSGTFFLFFWSLFTFSLSLSDIHYSLLQCIFFLTWITSSWKTFEKFTIRFYSKFVISLSMYQTKPITYVFFSQTIFSWCFQNQWLSLSLSLLGNILWIRFLYLTEFTLFETTFGFYNLQILGLNARSKTNSFFDLDANLFYPNIWPCSKISTRIYWLCFSH